MEVSGSRRCSRCFFVTHWVYNWNMIHDQQGSIYLVSTPIGHPKDITLRALEILNNVDAIICEEARPGSTLLKKLDIQKPLILLNEHNEQQAVPEITSRLLVGEQLALISDCGTPVFADPGRSLLKAAWQNGIRVIPIPGASSLMVAISVCHFDLDRFIFGGFLSRDGQQRRRELIQLQGARLPIILMDAPYRLSRMLEDVISVFGGDQPAMLACDLTLPGERILHSSLRSIMKQEMGKKSEFILVLDRTSLKRNPDRPGKRWV